MAIDPATGLLTWNPGALTPTSVNVIVKAYDRRGAPATLEFAIAVTGGNHAPVIQEPATEYTLSEGTPFSIGLTAFDFEGDYLTYFAAHLPPGAVFDAKTHQLVWTPGVDAAGTYPKVTLGVTDGVNTVTRSFTLLVRPVNQAPTLAPIQDRVVREGDPIFIQLSATDPEADTLTFLTSLLPTGAFLDPNTGIFEWTPGFTQVGTYVIPFVVSDGTNRTQRTTTFTVLNANGAPVFDDIGPYIILENQPLFFKAFAFDPDNPGFVPQDRVEGELTPLDGTDPTVTYTVEDLPPGATFDPITASFLWTPGFAQAGTYVVRFFATDDGDGLTPAVATRDVFITVGNANRAPVVPPVENKFVDVDDEISIPVSINDPDGDALTVKVFLSRQASQGSGAVDTTPVELGPNSGFATFVNNGDGTGVIHFAPRDGDGGDYAITIQAIDSGGAGGAVDALSASQTFILTVVAPNQSPHLDVIGDKVAVTGQPLSFFLKARDPDQDPLVFTATGLPPNMTLTQLVQYGMVRVDWTPVAGDIGTHSITFHVTDSGNNLAGAVLSDSQTISIVVRATNQAPLLLPVGNQTLTEGQPFVLQLAAIDPEGDPLTFGAENLPPGASLNAATGKFTWTPNFFDAGDYPGIVFTVSDGNLSSSETVTLHVANANRAPLFVPMAPQAGRENAALQFTLLAGDVDQDPVIYAALGALPQGAIFNRQTGVFTWTPNFNEAGTYVLKFGAVDPSGEQGTIDVTINIADTNRAPTLPLSNHQVVLGNELVFQLTGSDPDADNTLSYSAEGLPEGAILNPTTGEFRWTPGPGQAGDYLVLATVSDGKASVLEPFIIRATTAPVVPNVVIELTPSFPVVPGQDVLIHVIADGFTDIASLSVTYNGQPLNVDAQGRVHIIAGQPGRTEIVAHATDLDGVTGTKTAILKVRNPTDVVAPDVSFGAGVLGARISHLTDLRGSVLDTNLDSWTLAIALAGTGEFETIATGTTALSNAPLASIDPADFANGIYTLRLTASDLAGRTDRADVQIEINSQNKSGAYLRTETDLTASLSGHQIAINRQYDSLDSGDPGTFGYGWRLALRDVDIQTDVVLTGNEATGVYNPFREGTRVYLTLPDGERVGFTFEAVKHEISGLTYYTPSFTADPGVNWTLKSAAAQLIRVGDRYFNLNSGIPYNPAGLTSGVQYSLVAPDGTTYEIDAAEGVSAIVFSDGVRLLVADSGIYAPDGTSIAFVGGVHGLDRIIGPDGEQIAYLYDADGNLTLVRNLQTAAGDRYGYEAAHRLALVSGDIGAPGAVIDPRDWRKRRGHGRSRRGRGISRRCLYRYACGRREQPFHLHGATVGTRRDRQRFVLSRRCGRGRRQRVRSGRAVDRGRDAGREQYRRQPGIRPLQDRPGRSRTAQDRGCERADVGCLQAAVLRSR